MLQIEEASAFVLISSALFGAVNLGVNWGSRWVEWIPQHSASASAIVGGLAGAGSGVAISLLAFSPHQIDRVRRAQGVESENLKLLAKHITLFMTPFFMTLLCTPYMTLLLRDQLSMRITFSYAALDGVLGVAYYHIIKKC